MKPSLPYMKLGSGPLRCLFFAIATISLVGCSRNELVGRWTLDKEKTLSLMTEPEEGSPQASGPAETFLKDLAGGLQKGVSRFLLTHYDGVIIEFTDTEMRRLRGGVGETQTYEIVDQPDKDTYQVKMADGDIEIWNRVDEGIRLKLTDEGDTWIYFRPAAE